MPLASDRRRAEGDRQRPVIGKAGTWIALAVTMVAAASGGGDMIDEAETLVDFDRDDAMAWRAIDDVVMGGVSSSRLVPTEEGTAMFTGELSLENNGGFASVRTALGRRDLSVYAGIALRVRGDGRRYRLRLRTDERFDGIAYQASFDTEKDVWRTVWLPFTDFLPSFRGRTLEGVEPLARERVRQLGLMVADRQAGRFRLELDWIRAWATGPKNRGEDNARQGGPIR